MFEEYLTVIKFLGALVAGYLLGSLPFAQVAARYHGIDIFKTGSRTAGAGNVFRNVDRKTGLAVALGDTAKGSASVLVAGLLGLAWPLVLLVGGAVVLGHWKSIFTGFRGGDGVATLVGVSLAVSPGLAVLGLLVGTGEFFLSFRSPLQGEWALHTCFATMLAVSQYYQINQSTVLGLVVLGLVVFLHNRLSRQRRRLRNGELRLDLNL